MERFHKEMRPMQHGVSYSSYNPQRHQLGLLSQINIILKIFAMVGIDIIRNKKANGVQRLKIAVQLLYRWLMCILMLYFFVARLYKASQPNVPLMLSFSEVSATASSIVLRFVVLGKRQSLNKLLRSLQGVQTDDEIVPPAAYVRSEKIFFAFILSGFMLTMTLSITTALAELLSVQGFQMYRKAYLFSATFNNDTVLYKMSKGIVFASHLLFILNLYAVPSLCLLFCCLVCNGIGFFNLTLKAKMKDNPNYQDWKPSFVRVCINHLRRMNSMADRAENTLSIVLFFLYTYLLCSLFFIVSLTIRRSRGQNEIRQTYIIAAFLNLILFYIVLSVSAAKVRESVDQVRSVILLRTDSHSPSEMATLFVNVHELTRDIRLTGWGIFNVDRNFLLASAGVVVSYGVVLAQLSV